MTTSVNLNEAGDIVYVRLAQGEVAETRAFGDDRLVDLDAAGGVLGAEFICAEGRIDLQGMPEQRRLRDALLAAGPQDFLIFGSPPQTNESFALGRGPLSFLPSDMYATGRTLPMNDDRQLTETSGSTTLIPLR